MNQIWRKWLTLCEKHPSPFIMLGFSLIFAGFVISKMSVEMYDKLIALGFVTFIIIGIPCIMGCLFGDSLE